MFNHLAEAVRAVEIRGGRVEKGLITFPAVKTGEQWAQVVTDNIRAIEYMCNEWDCHCVNPFQVIEVDTEKETAADVAKEWHERIKQPPYENARGGMPGRKQPVIPRGPIVVDDKGRVAIPNHAQDSQRPLTEALKRGNFSVDVTAETNGGSETRKVVVAPEAIEVLKTNTDAKGNVTAEVELSAEATETVLRLEKHFGQMGADDFGEVTRDNAVSASKLFGLSDEHPDTFRDLPVFNIYEKDGFDRICTITFRIDSGALKRKPSQVRAARNAATAFAHNIRMAIGTDPVEIESANAVIAEVERCIEFDNRAAAAKQTDTAALRRDMTAAAENASDLRAAGSRQQGKAAAQQEAGQAAAAAGVPVVNLQPPARVILP